MCFTQRREIITGMLPVPAFRSFIIFESQYEKLDEIIDDVAERVRSLGHWSLGTLKDMIKLARLNEDIQASSAADMLKNLLDDHETVIRILREDVNTVTDKYSDLGTADFLTGLMEVHEKWLGCSEPIFLNS